MQTFNRSAPSSSNVNWPLADEFTIGRGRRARSEASLAARIEEMRSIFEIGVLTEGRERQEASLLCPPDIEEMEKYSKCKERFRSHRDFPSGNGDAPGKRHRCRTLCKILLLFGLLLAANGILCWLLEPFCSSSQEMWQNFHAMEQMDLVYTGTSQCLQGIDPLTVDAISGGTSYNMATNMQSLADSREAIAAAIGEYGIQSAVLAVDHEILPGSRTENARAAQSFWRGKAVTEHSIGARLRDDLRFMTSASFIGQPASLTYLTPWVYNRTSNVLQNVREKRNGEILSTAGHRNERGFQPSAELLDPAQEFISWEEAEAWDEKAVSLQDLSISEENRRELEGIRDLCKANEVELTVIILPYPNCWSIYRKDDVLRVDEELREIFAAEGFDFYDFNRILPEYYDASGNENYSDVGHMNEQGAERFSAFFGSFLKERRNGTDVDSWFRK